MGVKKPKMKIAIHHKTGTTCGSRPPQYQAACYRARHQKVPKFALDAEKKAKDKLLKKPAVKKAKKVTKKVAKKVTKKVAKKAAPKKAAKKAAPRKAAKKVAPK